MPPQSVNRDGGLRAGNAWYQAFTPDIIDEKGYGKMQMPVLNIAGPGYNSVDATLKVRRSMPNPQAPEERLLCRRRGSGRDAEPPLPS
jgi:hypothetical protein